MTTRSTSRITFEHVNSPQFQGQSVRAVGKLVAMDDGHVQLALAGSHEGGTRRAGQASWPMQPPAPTFSSLSRLRRHAHLS